ncbi:MAG: cadmium resistance transporter [Cyanobacteriota bacterium]|jgi:cadmium resistance protein CadD (predicted permease)|nr:cadmium resistance transporter [Cyanobacteriota bacterium]
MDGVIGGLQAAMAVAMATTFDDNIYLTGFFSETNRHFRPIHVVVGELLGFTALISTSFLASRLLAQTIPLERIGWLGLMPILIGIVNLLQVLQPAQTRLLEPPPQASRAEGFASKRPRLTTVLRQHHTYKVSAVTISNGGNNLSIYIPLLATSSLATALLTMAVCYAAVITWLTLSFRLTRLPAVAIHLSRHARRLFPFVLMWLGFRILHDSGALKSFAGAG